MHLHIFQIHFIKCLITNQMLQLPVDKFFNSTVNCKPAHCIQTYILKMSKRHIIDIGVGGGGVKGAFDFSR